MVMDKISYSEIFYTVGYERWKPWRSFDPTGKAQEQRSRIWPGYQVSCTANATIDG